MKKDAGDEQVDPHLFEFFVYHKMYRRLDKGLLCCNDSVTYCDIDHDLVNENVVDNVEEIANEFGYKKGFFAGRYEISQHTPTTLC